MVCFKIETGRDTAFGFEPDPPVAEEEEEEEDEMGDDDDAKAAAVAVLVAGAVEDAGATN